MTLASRIAILTPDQLSEACAEITRLASDGSLSLEARGLLLGLSFELCTEILRRAVPLATEAQIQEIVRGLPGSRNKSVQ
jgi:hypothetical protein